MQEQVLTIIGSVIGLMALQTTLLLWMMSKLDSDIQAIAADSNKKWIAVNARVDQTQSIIIQMLRRENTK